MAELCHQLDRKEGWNKKDAHQHEDNVEVFQGLVRTLHVQGTTYYIADVGDQIVSTDILNMKCGFSTDSELKDKFQGACVEADVQQFQWY